MSTLLERKPGASVARITAWECIGCGRIEGAQPCIGVCQDRKAEFVRAGDYDEVIEKLAVAREHTDALIALVRQLAGTTPHDDEWESTYRVMQARARTLLRRHVDEGRLQPPG